MSDSDDVTETAGKYESPKYESPMLTKLGNVRELLAGDGGTSPDVQINPNDPQQA
jgi:hypothetical protein